jgi:hypothetical protein
MGVAGSRRFAWGIGIGSLIVIGDVGFTRIVVGIGSRITRGVGRRFIMDAGSVMIAMAGCGGRGGPGGQRG